MSMQSETIAGKTGAERNEDDLARRAYFIALERHARGEPEDPLRDWLEAEREWVAERDRNRLEEPRVKGVSGLLVAGLLALGVLAYRFYGGRSNPLK